MFAKLRLGFNQLAKHKPDKTVLIRASIVPYDAAVQNIVAEE
jgi:hypothetical protein